MKTSTQKLRHAMLVIMGSSALAGVSSQAHALGAINLGEFTGSPISVVGYDYLKTFTYHQQSSLSYCCSNNQGYMFHLNWWKLQVGTATDIAAGTTFDIQLKAQSTGNSSTPNQKPLDNPSFAVWTLGAGNYTDVSWGSHGMNPTRGPNDSTGWTGDSYIYGNAAIGNSGVITGHDGWIGYVNSGASYTLTNWLDPINSLNQTASGNPYYDNVLGVSPGNTATYTAADGVLNNSSPWLTNPGASSTFATALNTNGNDNANPDYSVMNLYGLKAGNYVIAAAGACPGDAVGVYLNTCSNGQIYQFSVSTLAAVPVPGAVWLFGSAMAGLLGVQRRKVRRA